MRNRLPYVAVIALAGLLLAACPADDEDVAVEPPDDEQVDEEPADIEDCEEVTARASHHIGEETAGHIGMQTLADETADLTDGRVTIEVFPAGQLGGLVENAESLRTGAIEVALVDSSSFSHFFDEIGVMDLPFMFETQEQFNDLLDSDFGQTVDETIEAETGVVSLYWSSVGLRNMFFAPGVHEVTEPADLSGVTMRVPDAPVYQRTFDLLGASAVVVDAGELYTSMQTGVVDGFEFPLGTMVDFSMYEVVENMSITGHIHTNILIAASGQFVDSLCAPDREALFQAADVARDVTREGWIEDNENALEVMEDEGVNFVEADIDAFREAVQPMYEDFIEDHGSEWFDLIQDG